MLCQNWQFGNFVFLSGNHEPCEGLVSRRGLQLPESSSPTGLGRAEIVESLYCDDQAASSK